jgi:hypothetical protein
MEEHDDFDELELMDEDSSEEESDSEIGSPDEEDQGHDEWDGRSESSDEEDEVELPQLQNKQSTQEPQQKRKHHAQISD